MAMEPVSLMAPLTTSVGYLPAPARRRGVDHGVAPATTTQGSPQSTPDEVVALLHEILQRLDRLAVAGPPCDAWAVRSPAPLTSRQAEILGMVAAGRTTEEIAAELWLSVTTVRNHVSRGIRALGAHSRTQAIARARELGILQ